MKITVVGAGYVGLSMSILMAQNNQVTVLEIDEGKVSKINNRKSPINDKEVIEYLARKDLNIKATTDKGEGYKDAELIIIAAPTNFDEQSKRFDTSSIENVLKDIFKLNGEANILIKSTVPFGYTENIKKLFNTDRIIFSPEFLREGKALYDNLYPSRIVIGEKSDRAQMIAEIIKEGAIKKNVKVLFTDSNEAEAIKLFANTFLAMRVAYFNEIDTYASNKNLSTINIIEGVCADQRIGDHYNNPSFGYGGYCLPKDVKQLLMNYENTPQELIGAILKANETRKKYIADEIQKRIKTLEKNKTQYKVGVYRLIMKSESDNLRESAILDVIEILKSQGASVIIYEPLIDNKKYNDCDVVNNLRSFKELSSIIVTNRINRELDDVKYKVYSRDVFGGDM